MTINLAPGPDAPVEKADPQRRPVPQGMGYELGVAGLGTAGGQPLEPVPALRRLSGHAGHVLYEEMAREDATVGACSAAVALTLASVRVYVQPKDETPKAQELADFLRGALFQDMSHSWAEFLVDALTCVRHGFSLFEPIFKRRLGPEEKDGMYRSIFSDGRIGIRKLAPRHQLTVWKWDFDDAGGVSGVVQQPPNGGDPIDIPIERLVLFRTSRAMGNPTGESMLATSVRPWAEKKHLGSLEVRAADLDTTGTMIIEAPREVVEAESNPDPDDAKAAVNLKKLTGIRALIRGVDAGTMRGFLLSSEPHQDNDGKLTAIKKYSASRVGTAGQKAVDLGKAQEMRRTEIATAFFVQFLLLGSSGGRGGSRALSQDQSDFFTSAVVYLLEMILDVLNKHLVTRLWRLNGFDYELMPTLEHDRVEPADIQKLAAYVTALTGGGIPMSDTSMVNFLRRAMGGPELGPDDPRLEALDAEAEAAVEEARNPTPPSPAGAEPGGPPPAAPSGSSGTRQAPAAKPAAGPPQERQAPPARAA